MSPNTQCLCYCVLTKYRYTRLFWISLHKQNKCDTGKRFEGNSKMEKEVQSIGVMLQI